MNYKVVASVPKKTPPILRPVLSFTASVASSAVPAVADALPVKTSVRCIFTPGTVSTEPKSTPYFSCCFKCRWCCSITSWAASLWCIYTRSISCTIEDTPIFKAFVKLIDFPDVARQLICIINSTWISCTRCWCHFSPFYTVPPTLSLSTWPTLKWARKFYIPIINFEATSAMEQEKLHLINLYLQLLRLRKCLSCNIYRLKQFTCCCGIARESP